MPTCDYTDGANVAGWYLENVLGKSQIENSRLIELGAGIGFTSLIAKDLGASEVLITDGDEGVLVLADENIRLNLPVSELSSIKTARLRWNTEDEKLYNNDAERKPWDFIVVADCTYKKAAWKDLVASIVHLSGPQTKTIISSEPRSVGEVDGSY